MALRKYLNGFLLAAGCIGVQSLVAVEPDVSGIVTTTDGTVERRVSPTVTSPEQHSVYRSLVASLTVDFDMSAIPTGEGARRAFETFVKQQGNSGLTAGYLRRYEASILRAFKAQVLKDNFIQQAFESNARATITHLRDLSREKIERANRKAQREQQELNRAAEPLRRKLTDPAYASEKANIEAQLASIEMALRAVQLANSRYLRLSLDEIADKQGNWFFGVGDGERYATVMGWMERLMPGMAAKDEFKPSSGKPNLITDLDLRVKYIKDFAKAAYSGDRGVREGNKYAVSYVLSWFLTGLSASELEALDGGTAPAGTDTFPGSVDQAIALIEASAEPAPASPGTTDVTDPGTGPGTGPGSSGPAAGSLTPDQVVVYNAFMAKLREEVTFTLDDRTVRGQRAAYFVGEIQEIEATKTLQDKYIDTNNPSSVASRVESAWQMILASNHPKLPEARRVKEKFDQAAEGVRQARAQRDRVFEALQAAITAAGITFKAEDINSREKLLEFSRAVAAGNFPESQRQNILLSMGQYAEASLKWLHAMTKLHAAFKELEPIFNEITDDVQAGPSEQLQAMVDWIARYNRYRTANHSSISSYVRQVNGALSADIRVARNYTETVQNLLQLVETSFQDQKVLFDASVLDDPGRPAFQQCSSLFKDWNLNEMKYPRSSMASAVSSITSSVDTIPEKRLVCMANYEANLKSGSPDWYLFKVHGAQDPDSFGFKTRGVIDAMGSQRASVAVSATAEHSLHEGLYETLVFMKGLTRWLITYIKAQLEKEGVTASEVANNGVRSASAHNVALRIGDTILFDHNQHTIKATGTQTLEKIKKAFQPILTNQDVGTLIKEIVVEGHASPAGRMAYNQTLSERRANAVRDVLRNLGVVQYVARGIGERKPLNAQGNVVEYNPATRDLDTVPGVDAAKSRRVELSFSLNMVEIERILKDKGERFMRLRQLIASSLAAEPVPDVVVDPGVTSVDPDITSSAPVEVPAEAPAEVRGAVQKAKDWEAYLTASGRNTRVNDLWENPSIWNINQVQFKQPFARELIEVHNIIIIRNKSLADQVWATIGKYYEDINGVAGNTFKRESAQKDVRPKTVAYNRVGSGRGTRFVNPAIADMATVLRLIQTLQ